MSSLDSACDPIDLVPATVDTLAGIVENDIFGVDLVDRCASPLRVVLTEDVVKIAGQQSRYAIGHGLSPLGILPKPECRYCKHSRITGNTEVTLLLKSTSRISS